MKESFRGKTTLYIGLSKDTFFLRIPSFWMSLSDLLFFVNTEILDLKTKF